VCVILNLKTAKLAGEASEGMILAAVHKREDYEFGELVKPLSIPGRTLLYTSFSGAQVDV
jgi:tRNA-binding EMAP/Myf-like protein